MVTYQVVRNVFKMIGVISSCDKSNPQTKSIPLKVSALTTHLLPIGRADWPKLHGMFKAPHDAKT